MKYGGADRVRTDDTQLAKLVLFQLSYGPKVEKSAPVSCLTRTPALVQQLDVLAETVKERSKTFYEGYFVRLAK